MENSAHSGGALFNAGSASLKDCLFIGHSGVGSGGAIWNEDVLTVRNTAFVDNRANRGGGIFNTIGGSVFLINSTISGNSAINSGGAVFVHRGSLLLTNCTVTGNRANTNGNLYGDGGGVYLSDRGVVIIKNSIIAGNFVARGDETNDIAGRLSSASSHNLVGHAPSAGGIVDGVNHNQVGIDPRLAALQNRGGSTSVHPLLPGSPAIDAGSNALAVDSDGLPLITDQRGSGFDRVHGATVDLGAYEFSDEDRENLLGVFPNAVDLGQGWKWLDWFGSYNDGNSPWIFHSEHGWLHCIEDSESSTACYDPDLDSWLWISRNSYPSIYKFGTDSGWMWYYKGGTSGARRFHHFGISRDVEEAELALFPMEARPAVCVPNLESPAWGDVLDNGRLDGSDGTFWSFDWTDCPGAIDYHLHVKHSEARGWLISNEGIPDSSYDYGGGGSYIEAFFQSGWRWKVRARVGGEWGDWSEERSFDVEPVDTDPRP